LLPSGIIVFRQGKLAQPNPSNPHFAYPHASDRSAIAVFVICLVCFCREAYEQQLTAAGGDAAAVGALLPSGIIVFRQGKLAQPTNHMLLALRLLIRL
jgi:hypothetical protein